MSKENVASKIDMQGLDYWLTNYYDPDDIEEADLRQACERARGAVEEVETLLADYGYTL